MFRETIFVRTISIDLGSASERSTSQFRQHRRDSIERRVEVFDRRRVRQPHMMRGAEIVAADQGDLRLIEDQIGNELPSLMVLPFRLKPMSSEIFGKA